eukprot:TRINITY_DN17559_c0_g3_i1.p1 TRINITY_DN17559_c0_g3~~TRINITY_DN17559_c0_g3_i1.p1  ORF type:complete len:1062 (+),score=303.83 TRINITY_DN17559_c0_g3_i1:104-3187(+)
MGEATTEANLSAAGDDAAMGYPTSSVDSADLKQPQHSSASVAKSDAAPSEKDIDDGPVRSASESSVVGPRLSTLDGYLDAAARAVVADRLGKLKDLDANTKVPFIMIELRGEGPGHGSVDICGKDEYGVYSALDTFLTTKWGCTLKKKAEESEDASLIPFSERSYHWTRFQTMQMVTAQQGDGHPEVMVRRKPKGKIIGKFLNGTRLQLQRVAGDDVLVADSGSEGLHGWVKKNNLDMTANDDSDGTSSMGLNTMELIDFMCNHEGWTLGVINTGNVGEFAEIREQQVVFKAPHPMNLIVPHMMIELRSAGYVELCGTKNPKCIESGILDELHEFLRTEFKAEPMSGHENYCDEFWKCEPGVFQERGKLGENNLGHLTVKMMDFIGKGKPWSLVTMAGSNYGLDGQHREQQLIFRLDSNPLGEEPHLMVELRQAGYVEICGEDVDGIYGRLDDWMKSSWRVQDIYSSAEKFCDKKYKWLQGKEKDMFLATAEVIYFFQKAGWTLQLSSMCSPDVEHKEDILEQQMIFRPGGSKEGYAEPHMVMELYMGDGNEAFFARPEETQLLKHQYISIFPVGQCSKAIDQFHEFMVEYLGGAPYETDESTYSCDVFMARGMTENNLSFWTMRMCDFMVDQCGWSFVTCNLNNIGKYGHLRKQAMIFRWEGERRNIPVTRESELFAADAKSKYKDFKSPSYWTIPEVASGEKLQALTPCTTAELESMQAIMDISHRRICTRNRCFLPYRLEVVNAFRSENVPLTHRYRQRKAKYKKGESNFKAKTLEAGGVLNERLEKGEALLFHGTNPSSSTSVLKGGFLLDHAGKAAGTIFGYGIYMAECSSKSDEYAKEDNGGTYPGLMSLVVGRCLVGQCMQVQVTGDHCKTAKQKGFDCVLGDKESKVGTYREFIFFDEGSVLPEYSVIYKRVYLSRSVPESLRLPVVIKSEGKFWEVKVGSTNTQADADGWACIQWSSTQKLNEAQKDGKDSVSFEIGGVLYDFNFTDMTRKNLKTGLFQELRNPAASKGGGEAADDNE